MNKQPRKLQERYRMSDGVPTINRLHPGTKAPIALSEAEINAKCTDLQSLLEAFWATQPAGARDWATRNRDNK